MTATVTSPGPRTMNQLAAPIASGCCLVAAAGYVALNDPTDGGVFLPCPFRTVTGWWCPGCGLTRAIHHLFRGDVVQALRYNLFVIAIVAALAATWTAWLLHRAGRTIPVRIPTAVQVAVGTVLVAFAVIRNLPGVVGLRG